MKQAGQYDYQPIKHLTTSAATKRREQWRLNQRKCRERQRQAEAVMNLTPLSVDLFAEPFQVDHPGTPGTH